MKIAVISPDTQHLSNIQDILAKANMPHSIVAIIDGVSQVEAVVEQEQPDLLMLEGQDFSPADLQTLNRITSRFPELGMVLLCPPQAPEHLIEIMRAGVREVLSTPLDSNTLIEAIERFQQRFLLARMPANQCKVLVFIPCKGGSGATFLATNIAYALAALENKRIALFDLNLQFGEASLFVHDSPPATSIADVSRQIRRLDGAFLASSMIQVLPNFGVLAAPEEPEQALEVKLEHIKLLFQVAMQHYDFLIVDIPRTLNAISVHVLDVADLIFPVLQQTLPSVRDAKRMSKSFHALNYPDNKLRMIINRYEKNADISLSDVEETLNIKMFKVVPNDYDVVSRSVNHGIPVVKLEPRSPVTKMLQEIAHELSHGVDQRSLLKKLFS